jgi:hypothetical protein
LSLLGDDDLSPQELQRLKEAIANAADDSEGAGGLELAAGEELR